MIKLISFHDEQDYDSIRFRIVPWKQADDAEWSYTLVEEKMKDGRVVADLRRWLDQSMFDTLKAAVNGIEE